MWPPLLKGLNEMEQVATFSIGLDTPIHLLTPRQLFEMMGEWQTKINQDKPRQTEEKNQRPQRWYVNKIGELAEILGTSETTVYRMKADGQLDDCISQYGKWMMIDVDKVIEKFKLSNRRRKRK